MRAPTSGRASHSSRRPSGRSSAIVITALRAAARFFALSCGVLRPRAGRPAPRATARPAAGSPGDSARVAARRSVLGGLGRRRRPGPGPRPRKSRLFATCRGARDPSASVTAPSRRLARRRRVTGQQRHLGPHPQGTDPLPPPVRAALEQRGGLRPARPAPGPARRARRRRRPARGERRTAPRPRRRPARRPRRPGRGPPHAGRAGGARSPPSTRRARRTAGGPGGRMPAPLGERLEHGQRAAVPPGRAQRDAQEPRGGGGLVVVAGRVGRLDGLLQRRDPGRRAAVERGALTCGEQTWQVVRHRQLLIPRAPCRVRGPTATATPSPGEVIGWTTPRAVARAAARTTAAGAIASAAAGPARSSGRRGHEPVEGLDERGGPGHPVGQLGRPPGPAHHHRRARAQLPAARSGRRGARCPADCDQTKSAGGPIRRYAAASASAGTRAPRSRLATPCSASAAASACSGRACISSGALASSTGRRRGGRPGR